LSLVITGSEPEEMFCPTSFVPPLRHAVREQIAWLNLVKLAGRPVPMPLPGEAVPVLLIPGLGAGDYSLIPLARALRRQGHPTHASGMQANVGCTTELAAQMERRAEQIADRHRRPIAIVGHSRGGTLAKLVAASRPDLVENIVALATPNLNPLAAAPWVLLTVEQLAALNRRGVRGVLGDDCIRGTCHREVAARLAAPLPDHIGYTSIYSRSDGVVDWRACLDRDAHHIEVTTSHIGMAASRRVQRTVASQLAMPHSAPRE
jgi:triacylglycerol lipase